MRVYEIAKMFNLSNKEILNLLIDEGFDIKSHMAALSDDAIAFLEKKLQKKEVKEALISDHRANQQVLEPTVEVESRSQPKQGKSELPKKESALRQEEPIVQNEFIVRAMTVGEFAEFAKKPLGEIILLLLKQGIICAKNQMLPEKTIEYLAKYFGYEIRLKEEKKNEHSRPVVQLGESAQRRLPVVVVLGHVDHGKTTLLDFIRKTRVAAREKGGITQHLGAYQASTKDGDVVFLDTPGHAAFSNIRGRGVNVADIAVLVVAVDDGVMPQTIESIKKAKDAGLPIIVALNKIDKVDSARLETIRRELAQHGLLSEEWGGDSIFVPISAKTGHGVDNLLELIVLQSQIMDLKTDITKPAKGFVLESKIEKGRGPVATVICNQGVLSIGDFYIAGHTYGRVNSLTDCFGKNLKMVGSSTPVQVAGFSELPKAGDVFEVVAQDKYKAMRAIKNSSSTMTSLKKLAPGENAFKFIIKVDSSSTDEALIEALGKVIAKTDKPVSIIYHGVGDVTESDVVMAADTGATIFGLHVKIEPNAAVIAQKNIVKIHRFDIIYKLLEFIEDFTKKEHKVKLVTKKIGEASVLKVFAIKNIGTVAGAFVKEGRFAKEGKIIAWRGRKKLVEGTMKSLERDRKSVKEVHAGYEFAFLIEGFDDWQIDDKVECYLEVPEK